MGTPTLAPNSTWFTQGGTSVKRASITQIDIKDSYTPTGTVTSSWDASAAKDNSVKCYVEGTKLTIAGNGSGCIYANADSSWVFSDSGKKDYFTSLTIISGGNLLNTTNATSLARCFQSCRSLTTVDVSAWNTSRVTTMMCMFQDCRKISELNVSNWDTGNVTAMTAMFNIPDPNTNSSLTTLDVSNWDVSKVTSMQNMFWNCCGLHSLDLTKWNVSKVDLYKTEHHCYNTKVSEEWLDKLNPSVAVTTRADENINDDNYTHGILQLKRIPNFVQYDVGNHIVVTSTGYNFTLNTTKNYLRKKTWFNKNQSGNWYYFKNDGTVAKSQSLVINSKTYYFDDTGLCTNPNI
jgi:surface protein